MPTYHYHCPNGHDFEHFERKISSRSRRKCPECGKMAARQISGGAGLIFKGSGFYITDYKKAGTSGPGADESPAKETKPDAASKKAEGKTPDSRPKGKDS
jgi:putative FmdB family regulatory protein